MSNLLPLPYTQPIVSLCSLAKVLASSTTSAVNLGHTPKCRRFSVPTFIDFVNDSIVI